MTKRARQFLILGVLVLAGITVAVLRWPSSGGSGGGAAAPASADSTPARADDAVGDIRLESLELRADGDPSPSRDVFRFDGRRASSTPDGPGRPSLPGPVNTAQAPPVATGPPPPPPIPLRFIGYLDQPGQAPRVAVLSDGRGNVFNGREGDIIEGRYRVLRIGTESADLVYVDGRGRQTIRLSGQ